MTRTWFMIIKRDRLVLYDFATAYCCVFVAFYSLKMNHVQSLHYHRTNCQRSIHLLDPPVASGSLGAVWLIFVLGCFFENFDQGTRSVSTDMHLFWTQLLCRGNACRLNWLKVEFLASPPPFVLTLAHHTQGLKLTILETAVKWPRIRGGSR